MDPSETFRMIVSGTLDLSVVGANEACREELIDNLRNFADWLEKGGFVPNCRSLTNILESEARHL